MLDELGLTAQVEANISFIQDEFEKRSQTLVYRDIKDPEERFILIAPGLICDLIKKGKIDEKKIDEAIEKLENLFPVVNCYGVLLLITAYILEHGEGDDFIAKPSLIYSQIDITCAEMIEETIVKFGGDIKEAIKSFESKFRMRDEYPDHYHIPTCKILLAQMYDRVGRTEDAVTECKEIIALTPNFWRGHYYLGVFLSHLGRSEEAKKEYREAIRIAHYVEEVHNNLGNLLLINEQFEEAEKEYKKAIEINSRYAEAHYNLGILLHKLEQYKEAEKEYKDAIRIKPNVGDFHCYLGRLYWKMGRFHEAKDELMMAKSFFEEQGRKEDVKRVEKLLIIL